jgi:hypothetical protein
MFPPVCWRRHRLRADRFNRDELLRATLVAGSCGMKDATPEIAGMVRLKMRVVFLRLFGGTRLIWTRKTNGTK